MSSIRAGMKIRLMKLTYNTRRIEFVLLPQSVRDAEVLPKAVENDD